MASPNLTEWPPDQDLVLLCISGGRGHWVQGFHFHLKDKYAAQILVCPMRRGDLKPINDHLVWVGQGEPKDWHVFDPAACHE